jgi:hypothetical protein
LIRVPEPITSGLIDLWVFRTTVIAPEIMPSLSFSGVIPSSCEAFRISSEIVPDFASSILVIEFKVLHH